MKGGSIVSRADEVAATPIENNRAVRTGVDVTTSPSPPVPRREFLVGLAALGASALVSGISSAAQAPVAVAAKPYRIDVHYHFSSPGFIAAITARKTGQRPLMEKLRP